MRSAKFVLTLIGVLSTGLSHAGDEHMQFVDLRNIDRADLAQRVLSTARVTRTTELELRAADVGSDSPTGFERPVARVKIDAASLVPFSTGLVRLAGTDSVVRLTVRGERYDLAIVDVTFDRSFDVYHVAAVTLGTEDGYGRFTVDENDGTVIGTLYSAPNAWRIAPNELGEGLLVRPVAQGMGGGARNDMRSATRSARNSQLEARHIQMLRVAELNPRRFHTDGGQIVAMDAEEVERIDLTGIVSSQDDGIPRIAPDALAAQLNAALERMRPMTQQSSATLVVQNIVAAPTNLLVRVNQVVDGIPVEPSGVFNIDPASGRIRNFSMLLADTTQSRVDRSRWLDEQSAAALVQSGLIAKFGRASGLSSKATLRYLLGSEGGLRPEWVFQFDDGRAAVVNAISGTTEVYDTQGYVVMGQVLCDANGTAEQDCGETPSAGAPAVWKASDLQQRVPEGTLRCYPVTTCNQRFVDGFNAIEQFENYVTGTPGSGTWERVDIIDGAQAQQGQLFPAYRRTTKTIILPPIGQGALAPNVDPLSPAARNALYHEMAHAHQEQIGPASLGDPVLASLGEGMADAVAAIMGGNDWQPYDGILPGAAATQRNLAIPKNISDWEALTEPHERGLVFGHMVFKLYQKAVGATALQKISLQTYTQMQPGRCGHPSTYDVCDVYEAMLVVAGADATFRTAIQEVWAEMGNNPTNNSGANGPGAGTPPPPNVPWPPAYVEGYITSCNGGQTLHSLSWANSLGATSWNVYYSSDGGVTYWWASPTVWNTSAVVWNVVNVRFAVKACNHLGCSWISSDYYSATHVC